MTSSLLERLIAAKNSQEFYLNEEEKRTTIFSNVIPPAEEEKNPSGMGVGIWVRGCRVGGLRRVGVSEGLEQNTNIARPELS